MRERKIKIYRLKTVRDSMRERKIISLEKGRDKREL